MKKLLSLLLVVALLCCCVGCSSKPADTSDTTTTTTVTTTTTQKTNVITTKPTSTQVTSTSTTKSNTTSKPTTTTTAPKSTTTNPSVVEDLPALYVDVEELTAEKDLEKVDWDIVLKQIPSDHYVAYPHIHQKPLRAKLYKDGKITIINPFDPRLVKLINFYNNCIHHKEYAYTQGAFSPDEYSFFSKEPFRLVLEHIPNGEPSHSTEEAFDEMIVVAHTVVGKLSNTPYGDGTSPFSAFGRYPLYDLPSSTNLLTLFGF